MPETRPVREARSALARAAKLAKLYSSDPTYARRLHHARQTYLEARAVATMQAALDQVAGLDLDPAGVRRIAAALGAA